MMSQCSSNDNAFIRPPSYFHVLCIFLSETKCSRSSQRCNVCFSFLFFVVSFRVAATVFQSVRRRRRLYGDERPDNETIQVSSSAPARHSCQPIPSNDVYAVNTRHTTPPGWEGIRPLLDCPYDVEVGGWSPLAPGYVCCIRWSMGRRRAPERCFGNDQMPRVCETGAPVPSRSACCCDYVGRCSRRVAHRGARVGHRSCAVSPCDETVSAGVWPVVVATHRKKPAHAGTRCFPASRAIVPCCGVAVAAPGLRR